MTTTTIIYPPSHRGLKLKLYCHKTLCWRKLRTRMVRTTENGRLEDMDCPRHGFACSVATDYDEVGHQAKIAADHGQLDDMIKDLQRRYGACNRHNNAII